LEQSAVRIEVSSCRQPKISRPAAFAQSGGGFSGSAADVMKQSATNAELDSLMIRYESDLKATGLKNQAAGEEYAGKVAKQAGYYGAIGSVLSGGSTYLGLTA